MSSAMTQTKEEEWKADAQAADPSVLPEYTAIPPSPLSLPAAAEPSAHDSAYTQSHTHPRSRSRSPSPSPSEDGGRQASEGRRILRTVKRGTLAIVLPPVVVAGAALAAAAAMVYGAGKILEGVGRAFAAGPEALYRVCVRRRARAAWRAVRGRRERGQDVEGAIMI